MHDSWLDPVLFRPCSCQYPISYETWFLSLPECCCHPVFTNTWFSPCLIDDGACFYRYMIQSGSKLIPDLRQYPIVAWTCFYRCMIPSGSQTLQTFCLLTIHVWPSPSLVLATPSDVAYYCHFVQDSAHQLACMSLPSSANSTDLLNQVLQHVGVPLAHLESANLKIAYKLLCP